MEEYRWRPPKLPHTGEEKESMKRLIIVLEDASLRIDKVNDRYQLLNAEQHHGFLSQLGEDPATFRPDITHQCLLTLQNHPLNRAGLLQVFIHTKNGVLVEVSPHTKVPLSFTTFSKLTNQLLWKYSVRAAHRPLTLLRVIKNPITDHLPTGCLKIGTSHTSRKVNLYDFVNKLEDKPIVFVIGAISHGNISPDFTEDSVCISECKLSAAGACAKLCNAFEEKWVSRDITDLDR
eukprot:TRINITY_DN8313_c0_g1_i1.p1 TRINITY_DN8313_c0_g1~~TRINITY_DN8313_c0_g1_i1.p1  ORF type:complete len:241 (+),score=31.71 TRINITY_DN8313_c0_g1_i1:24-725(+)